MATFAPSKAASAASSNADDGTDESEGVDDCVEMCGAEGAAISSAVDGSNDTGRDEVDWELVGDERGCCSTSAFVGELAIDLIFFFFFLVESPSSTCLSAFLLGFGGNETGGSDADG